MNQELPPDLESTRDLLAGSLQIHSSEEAPAMPSELLNDLARRFAPAAAPAPAEKRSWFQAVQDFVGRPAFGLAAVAAVVLVAAVPALLPDGPTTGGAAFRGATGPAGEAPSVRILLVNPPAGVEQQLQDTGDFESGVISSAADRTALTGPAVIVDFTNTTLTTIGTAGNEVTTTGLPSDPAELAATIATAVSGL